MGLTEREHNRVLAIRQTIELIEKQRTLLTDLGLKLGEMNIRDVELQVADAVGLGDVNTWFSQTTRLPCAAAHPSDMVSLFLTTEGAAELIERKLQEAKNELS